MCELLAALKDYPQNFVEVEENDISDDIYSLKNDYKSDVNGYKEALEKLKKKYINCFYLKEYTDDQLKDFKDKYGNKIFTD